MAISRANIRQQVTKGPQKKKWTRKYKKSINCKNPKGFSCKASCKAKGKVARTGGEYKGKKIKSKKYGGPA